VSDCVQALPSLQGVPFVLAGFEQAPLDGSQAPAAWHWSDAAQVTGLDPAQIPEWQASVCVQALPSLHAAPSALAGFEHTPVAVLQVPATWHWSSAAQVTGFDPAQVPAWQVSVCVHALPSSQVAPLALVGFEQTPVLALHAPTSWHWSWATQVTKLEPRHTPAWHVSLREQAFPSLHEAPFPFAGFVQAPVAASHAPASWH
jgi:hypothetical protein